MAAFREASQLTSGAALFQQFLTENAVRRAHAARSLGVTAPAVHDWLKGRRRPNAIYRVAVETYTNGAVRAASWDTAEERAKVLDGVRPFVAPAASQAA